MSEGSSGGITGRPTKVDEGAIAECVLFVVALKPFLIAFKLLFRRKGRIYSAIVSC